MNVGQYVLVFYKGNTTAGKIVSVTIDPLGRTVYNVDIGGMFQSFGRHQIMAC